MENRGHKYHMQRMGESLREEITALLEGELADPRIGLASVSEVHLASDGRSAHIFVAAMGDEEEQERMLEGLASATGFIRRQITHRLGLRRAPELFFHLDKTQEYGTRIDELLRRVKKRAK